MILRARSLITMDGPPIEDGAVVVRGNAIHAVGPWSSIAPFAPDAIVDLGERVLLPGLINAHCHLDYTMMRNSIVPPKSFTQWIQRINAIKRSLHDDDYLRGIAAGFRELKTWGTTTVVNLEAFPELLPKLPPPPIRSWWFYELIDLRQRVTTDELFAGAFAFFDERPEWLGGFGLNPHSPYTASPQLYRLAHQCARATGMLLTTHLAESAEEMAMFRHAEGPLFEFLKSLGRDMRDCGGSTPVGVLARLGVLDGNSLLAHLNELEEADFTLLAEARPHVVHCPRSHSYFKHRPFAFRRLSEAGVNISLGTDSLASNDALNLFAEMQALQKTDPWLTPAELLATVTRKPALALGLPERLGKIAPGALADLIALPFAGRIDESCESVVNHRAPIDWMMVNGQLL
jgi:cytosine/adenosine deaminase-related metal-dependent hydrolase